MGLCIFKGEFYDMWIISQFFPKFIRAMERKQERGCNFKWSGKASLSRWHLSNSLKDLNISGACSDWSDGDIGKVSYLRNESGMRSPQHWEMLCWVVSPPLLPQTHLTYHLKSCWNCRANWGLRHTNSWQLETVLRSRVLDHVSKMHVLQISTGEEQVLLQELENTWDLE